MTLNLTQTDQPHTDIVADPAFPPVTEDPRITSLERRLVEQTEAHHARLAQAELKLHAVRAGMIDLDGLKLVDTARIKLNDRGEVDGADRLMAELRRDKPWLFHHATTSSTSAPPPSTPPSALDARKMSHTEWQAARATLLKRR